MFIKRLSVTNFKSFDHLDITLDKLNIVIGANASGKSNFISIFDFLRNIANHGLENAVSMAGGAEYLRNQISMSDELNFRIHYEPFVGYVFGENDDKLFKILEATYEFALKYIKRHKCFKVTKDRLDLNCEFYPSESKLINGESGLCERGLYDEILGTGYASFDVKNGKVEFDYKLPNEFIKYKDEIVPANRHFKMRRRQINKLLLESAFFNMEYKLENPFNRIKIYDIDSRLSKRPVAITGITELEEDGGNLSIVLMNIIQDKEKKRRYLNLIGDLLPFVNDIKIKNVIDKSVLFTIQEKYIKNKIYLPTSSLSVGTVNIAALIAALYYEYPSLTIIEEPDRDIHPYIISRLVNMFKEIIKWKKQIIITTHNPEVVKHAPLDSLLLIARNENGISTISKPSENKKLKIFLKNEMGVDELFIHDLIGATSDE